MNVCFNSVTVLCLSDQQKDIAEILAGPSCWDRFLIIFITHTSFSFNARFIGIFRPLLQMETLAENINRGGDFSWPNPPTSTPTVTCRPALLLVMGRWQQHVLCNCSVGTHQRRFAVTVLQQRDESRIAACPVPGRSWIQARLPLLIAPVPHGSFY